MLLAACAPAPPSPSNHSLSPAYLGHAVAQLVGYRNTSAHVALPPGVAPLLGLCNNPGKMNARGRARHGNGTAAHTDAGRAAGRRAVGWSAGADFVRDHLAAAQYDVTNKLAHGQGLAWSALLSGERRACLEIIGTGWHFRRPEYKAASSYYNGAKYVRLKQRSAEPLPDHVGKCNFRDCGNLTANVSQVVDALHRLRRYVDGG